MNPNRKRAINIGSLLLVILLAALGREQIVAWMSGSSSKIPISTLHEELVRIPVPSAHVRLSEIKTFDRATSAAAVSYYQASGSPASVVLAYRALLKNSDWKFAEEQTFGGRREVRAKFCKGEMSLTVDATPVTNSNTYYYLGIAWAEAENAPAHCGK